MAETTYTVDRIEDGEWIVLEGAGGRSFSVPRSWLPTEAKEGDSVQVRMVEDSPAEGGRKRHLVLTVAPGGRDGREGDVRRLRDQLEAGPAGDISL